MEKIVNNRFNEYVFNLRKSFVGLNLIVAYHSVMSPPYYNPILPDTQWKEQTFAFLVLQGSIRFLTKNGETVVSKDELMFGSSDGDVVLVDNGTDAEFLCFHFQIFNCTLPMYAPHRVKSTQNTLAEFSTLLSCMRMQNDLGIGSANGIFMNLLFSWLREIRANSEQKIPNSRIIFDAQLYINERIETPLTVSALAKKYNFCEKHFRNLFEKVLGISPKAYITRVKIERAHALLKNTSLSVSEIAERLCYASAHHLSNAFKKEYGISPTACRKA